MHVCKMIATKTLENKNNLLKMKLFINYCEMLVIHMKIIILVQINKLFPYIYICIVFPLYEP